MFWKHWIISLSLLTTTSLALAQVDSLDRVKMTGSTSWCTTSRLPHC